MDAALQQCQCIHRTAAGRTALGHPADRKGRNSHQIYDLADGQTYTRAIEWDKVEGWNAGYPEKLLANDKILVSNGSYTDVYGIDRKAYAVMDCAAYLAGSTDYTPIAMYTGD